MALSTSKLPWLIDLTVFMTPISHTNWDFTGINGLYTYNANRASSSAQNDEISFDVVLAQGTWTIDLLFTKDSDSGIYSVQLDSVEQGTIDGYAASATYNQRGSVAGITVSTTGVKRLKLKMATKNASSSNYAARLQHIQLLRTA